MFSLVFSTGLRLGESWHSGTAPSPSASRPAASWSALAGTCRAPAAPTASSPRSARSLGQRSERSRFRRPHPHSQGAPPGNWTSSGRRVRVRGQAGQSALRGDGRLSRLAAPSMTPRSRRFGRGPTTPATTGRSRCSGRVSVLRWWRQSAGWGSVRMVYDRYGRRALPDEVVGIGVTLDAYLEAQRSNGLPGRLGKALNMTTLSCPSRRRDGFESRWGHRGRAFAR